MSLIGRQTMRETVGELFKEHLQREDRITRIQTLRFEDVLVLSKKLYGWKSFMYLWLSTITYSLFSKQEFLSHKKLWYIIASIVMSLASETRYVVKIKTDTREIMLPWQLYHTLCMGPVGYFYHGQFFAFKEPFEFASEPRECVGVARLTQHWLLEVEKQVHALKAKHEVVGELDVVDLDYSDGFPVMNEEDFKALRDFADAVESAKFIRIMGRARA